MSLLGLYRFGAAAAAPLVRRHLDKRLRLGKEDPQRLPERLGFAGLARPAGPLCWLHGASVGEALSILPLIEQLQARYPGLHLLVTTGTRTSAGLLARRLPEGVTHQYVPVDLPQAAARFLDHWRPGLALWTESELWPALIQALAVRDVPLVLLNGRLSDTSFRRWRRLPGSARALLQPFRLCLAQTEADAARFKALGAPRVEYLGNLKFAAPPLPCDEAEMDRLREAAAGRPCWVAASTHEGEEEIVAAAHRALCRRHPDLLTLIVPRHPERGAALARDLAAAGCSVARRAGAEAIAPGIGIYLADTIGELGLWYRLGQMAFVGGSLTQPGGQNPLEPARLGRAILHGPGMANFAAIAEGLARAGASRVVRDAETLGLAVEELLFAAPERRRAMAAAASSYAASEAEVLARVLARLDPFLAGLKGANCQGGGKNGD